MIFHQDQIQLNCQKMTLNCGFCQSSQRVSDLNLKKETFENSKMKHRMSRQGTEEKVIMMFHVFVRLIKKARQGVVGDGNGVCPIQ